MISPVLFFVLPIVLAHVQNFAARGAKSTSYGVVVCASDFIFRGAIFLFRCRILLAGMQKFTFSGVLVCF